ncbi:MAG: nucleotidyltransferase domain-containing protein [Candidatus Nealsonbacteria bacterium]
MKTEDLIKEIKEKIVKETKPISIFIYGSYVTKEYLPGISDVEIGVIKKGDRPVFRILRKITKKHSKKNVSFKLYSFHLEDLKNQRVDSPFTDSIFIRRLVLTSKTIWGKKVIENLPLPPIDIIDAYREACSSVTLALTGLLFLRENKLKEAHRIGSKACLFATASLEYLVGEFPIGLKNIVKTSRKLKLDKKWRELINFAYNLKLNKIKPKKEELYNFIYKTITYCNQIVEEKIRTELKKGNRVLVE